MKNLKFAITALCAGFVSAAVVSCDPKTTISKETAYEALAGNYKGEMTCTVVEGEIVGTDVTTLGIQNQEIIFTSFPLTSIVTAIVGAEEATGIIEMVGDMAYNIGFTATFNEAKTEIGMVLTPEELTITLGEGEEVLEIKVTVSAVTGAKYVVDGKKLTFALNVDKVALNGADYAGFTPLLLEFDMTQD